MSILKSLFRETLRKILLRVLIFTEKQSEEKPTSPRQKDSLLRKDIHIPPVLVAALSACFLVIVLLLGVGWSWKSLLSLTLFVFLLLSLFIFYLKRDFPQMLQDDEAIMLLGTLTILFVSIIGALKRWPVSFYLTPIPAAAILCTLLLHARLAIILTTIVAVVLGMMHGFSFDCFFLGFFGGMAGTAAAIQIRTQRDFIRAGTTIAVVHFLTFTALCLLHRSSREDFLWGTLWTVLNGFLSAILALGLLPFLESFFLRISPMKLLELADFNQPLLKRLMVEAPGTYHHSLMVATIAEAAARAIGANPLLARVGAYYHDVGKLVKPEYFIENQGNMGYNPHGNLAPALSSLVVVSHIKEGIALAQEAKLPPEIIHFIPMHHGTGRVEYFYHQAKENAAEESFESAGNPNVAEVQEGNYRYPGPRPLTKETAVVMLADSVEAASRTIDEPSHLRFKDLVENIVRTKVSDTQLSKSPLTLADLSTIQESFVNTLTSIYHARIEYPDEG